MSTLYYPLNNSFFDTHTQEQNEFIDQIMNYGTEKALEWLSNAEINDNLLFPAALKFSWQDISSSGYIFEIAQEEDFSDAVIKNCDQPFCEITNLEIGKKYFWRVNGGDARTFLTKNNLIRFIKIDGIINVRDLGGNKIKQGIIYRGSALDTDYNISENGKYVFRDSLKIKTEIDLRAETDEKEFSSAGENISFKRLPYRPYVAVFEDEHKRELCKIMEVLSCEENYPIYIHCLRGADRTGMVAFFLKALAGESEELIHLDYEMTALATYAEGIPDKGFGIRNRNRGYYIEFLDRLDTYAPSKSLYEKTMSFLLDCGVERECIEKIINIIKE